MKYIGIWEELKNILEDNKLKFLEEKKGENFSICDFLHGFCFTYAWILAHRLDLNIRILVDYENTMVHAFCFKEINGETWYFDARGATTDFESFLDEYEFTEKDLKNDWGYINEYGREAFNMLKPSYTKYIGFEAKDARFFIDLFCKQWYNQNNR